MTPNDPPRLAMSLLTRYLPADDPLIGDLVEEFQAGRGALWFWQQAAAAAAAGWWRSGHGVRPLRLVDDPSRLDLDPRPEWPRTSGGPLAYLSASPVSGIGGLGLLAVIVLVTLVAPQIWTFVASSIVAGVALGVVLARRTARRMARRGPAAIGGVLFGDDPATVTRTAGPATR